MGCRTVSCALNRTNHSRPRHHLLHLHEHMSVLGCGRQQTGKLDPLSTLLTRNTLGSVSTKLLYIWERCEGLCSANATDGINFPALHQLVNVRAREEAEQVLHPAEWSNQIPVVILGNLNDNLWEYMGLTMPQKGFKLPTLPLLLRTSKFRAGRHQAWFEFAHG